MDQEENYFNIKHLYHRAGFGISYSMLHKLSKKRLTKAIDGLLDTGVSNFELSMVTQEDLANEQMALAALGTKKEQSPEEKKQRVEITRKRNARSRELNMAWVKQLITTDNPLLEKMTLFWHGHFACRTNQPFFAQQLNNIQRRYALGNFRDLLIAVSQSPAMLDYLNNQQNRKGRPNENFSRELMELFTLGRGNYTERDVKEAARAFTGWSYNKKGEFEFRERVHDGESKTFFGQTGNFNGEQIIDIILQQPEAAAFISRKIYLFFVSEEPNNQHIIEMASCLRNNNYEISALMKMMLNAGWFYAKENKGNKIKSPIELLVGLSRQFSVTYNKPQVLIQLQSSLGQYLFNPPNVAGWPGGRNWIDSSSLMLRMKIPSLILNDGILDFNGKADPEDEALIALNKQSKPKPVRSYVNAQADWKAFTESLPKNMKQTDLVTFLLQPALSEKKMSLAVVGTQIKNIALAVTSMPEYQLC